MDRPAACRRDLQARCVEIFHNVLPDIRCEGCQCLPHDHVVRWEDEVITQELLAIPSSKRIVVSAKTTFEEPAECTKSGTLQCFRHLLIL